MAISTKNKLNLDRIDRSQKLQTLVALANASYRIKDKEQIVETLKTALEIFKDKVKGSKTGAGKYSGESMDQFQSKYTPGLEFGIWKSAKRDNYELSDLAIKLVEGDITPKYYLSTTLMNFIQIIDNKVLHPLMCTLNYLISNNKQTLTVEDIKSISEFNIKDDRDNAGIWFEYLKDSLFFKLNDLDSDVLEFNKELFDIEKLVDSINKEYLNCNANEVIELFKNQDKWAEYLGKENSILKSFKLAPIVINEVKSNNDNEKLIELKPIDRERNRLIYGAPGTGKSYMLEADRINYFEEENYERVTFYPDYSYGQFVGVYKPSTDNGHIKYDFTPGPFLRLLVEALKNKDKNYLVIIEEINRANAAAVFGDMFQLLDRDNTGKSTYAISLSEDVKKYMKSKEINEDKLYLPGNFYIWATMNSADQGVTILDAAFKRRFDEYKLVSINENEDLIKDIEVEINGVGLVKWNEFRKQLNKHLISNFKVREDRLIGPFFIKPSVLQDKDKFNSVFTDKLLMYLAEDVLNHKKKDFFKYISLSEMRDVYLKDENCIFKEEFWNLEEDNIDAN